MKPELKIDFKFCNHCSGQVYISAASFSSCQSAQKAASMFDDIMYFHKTAGSGSKVKYAEQTTCIIEAVVTAWETRNFMSKSSAYDFLNSHFVHEN